MRGWGGVADGQGEKGGGKKRLYSLLAPTAMKFVSLDAQEWRKRPTQDLHLLP